MPTKCTTSKIGYRAALNALHGVRCTHEEGAPINLSVCIHFEALGVPEEDACEYFNDLRERVSRWWRYQRVGKGRDVGQIRSYFAHANPACSRHVHWQIHVPDVVWDEFQVTVAKLLKKILGRLDLKDALHFLRVETAGSHAKYVLKGVDPAYAALLHIRAANEGLVTGRRTGVSRAISKAARKKRGWDRTRRPRSR